jgi:hypothetical protein
MCNTINHCNQIQKKLKLMWHLIHKYYKFTIKIGLLGIVEPIGLLELLACFNFSPDTTGIGSGFKVQQNQTRTRKHTGYKICLTIRRMGTKSDPDPPPNGRKPHRVMDHWYPLPFIAPIRTCIHPLPMCTRPVRHHANACSRLSCLLRISHLEHALSHFLSHPPIRFPLCSHAFTSPT